MNASEFLMIFYKGVLQGYITVWTLQDKRTKFFKVTDTAAAAAYAETMFDTHDVYFGVGLRRDDLGSSKRGGNNDVCAITALWADIDIRGEAHKETALPQDETEALKFLNSLPHPPSIVVLSGNGLHAYWLLKKPLVIATDAHRKNISNMLKGWQLYINGIARNLGWKLDNTSDLSRVLRIPGGINHKLGNNVRSAVIAESDVRYSPQYFTAYLPAKATQQSAPTAAAQSKFNLPVGNSDLVIKRCAFCKRCCDDAPTLSEPYWNSFIKIIALCADGAEACHEFSKPYPRYNPDETDRKIARALAVRKPHTCEYIQKSLGFNCGNCTATCKSPIGLAVITRTDEVREKLEEDITDYQTVFNDEYIDALSYAKTYSPNVYAQFKLKHKGKINIRDLEACIKNYDSKKRHKSETASANGEELILDGIDLGGAVIPRKWKVTINGVYRLFEGINGTEEIIVCPNPVVITRRLANLDDGKERIELTFRIDGHWKSVIGNRTQVYNKNNILGFGDDGLHVTSSTASELVNYLSDYEIANNNVIPRVSSISRLGWVNDTQFFPCAVDGDIVFEEDKGTAVLYRNLTENGDYDVWKNMISEIRKNPIARFIIAASFVSPLLIKIGIRTFVIHIWHTSGSGKSAALKAAISVWVNPLRITGNGFTTIVGTEQLAGTLKHLPLGIDEKQAADDRHLSFEQLVYILGQSCGKIRGAKGGGNAEVATWHNVNILTGEEPITRNSSLDGIQSRTFEIYGKPVENMEFAKEVHIISENNYGFAGKVFMRAICDKIRENPGFLTEKYKSLSDELKAKGLKNIHADYATAVALGDMLAETVIFGTDENTARLEAVKCAETVYALNETQMSADVVERATEFITGWLVSNEQRFSTKSTPYYGKMEKKPNHCEYSAIPSYLDAALEEAGFNVRKTLQGLRESKFINTQKDSNGSERTKSTVNITGKNTRCYVFHIESNNAQPLNNSNSAVLCGSSDS